MESFDHLDKMFDVKLKAKLLQSLIQDCLPNQNETVPTSNPELLSHVVYAVKSFGLLSESLPEPSSSNSCEEWNLAVDAWVEQLLSLISSDLIFNCWVGTSLLGQTCIYCSSRRFLASYPVWLDKLLSLIRWPLSDYESVKAASCASISDMFTRLGGYSNDKKEGESHAAKVIRPVLKLLNEDSSESVLEEAVRLFGTIINFFPSALRHDYITAEGIIISKFISGSYGVNTLKKYAHCLALLPKSRGDADSWSAMMQKLLISIDMDLTNAFRGLKEGKDSSAALASLPGTSAQASEKSIQLQLRSHIEVRQLLTNRVAALMLCCCTMITAPYPVEVVVPVGTILATVWRVLTVDGSLCEPLMPIRTVMQPKHTCWELSMFQLYSLDLLTAVLKALNSQLWSHTGELVRILTSYFRTCALAPLRIKVYSVVRILLISMGIGIALSMDQEIVRNAFVDLEHVCASSKIASEGSHSSLGKRKHDSMTGSLKRPMDEVGSKVDLTKNNSTSPIPLKTAALEALEALLALGGQSGSESWRSNVDLLVMDVATDAFDEKRISKEANIFELANQSSLTWADFQLAALRALLASLLSQRQLHLSSLIHGLDLFHKGREEVGTRVADFCVQALLSLEVLAHSRQLLTMDFSSASFFNGGLSQESLENTDLDGDNLDGDDALHDNCDGESEAPPSNPSESIKIAEEPRRASVQQVITCIKEEILSMDGSPSVKIPEESQHLQAVSPKVDKGSEHEIMIIPKQFHDPILTEDAKVPMGSIGSEVKAEKDVPNFGTFDASTN